MFCVRLTVRPAVTDPTPIGLALFGRYGVPAYPEWQRDAAGCRYLNLGEIDAQDVARHLVEKGLADSIELAWDTPRGLYSVP